MSETWQSQLQQASWRGVPFAVLRIAIRPGRQTALHVIPFRQTSPTWAEDIGLGPSPFSVTGFLLENDLITGGPDLYAQRAAMIAACQQPGPGTFVHPSMGSYLVQLINGAEMIESLGSGGSIELRFEFQETLSGPVYPSATVSSQNATQNAAEDAGDAVASDYSDDILPPAINGAPVVGQIAATVIGWSAIANRAVGDAARAINCVQALAGNFGRYSNGSNSMLLPASATVASRIAASTTAATAVVAASAKAAALAASI